VIGLSGGVVEGCDEDCELMVGLAELESDGAFDGLVAGSSVIFVGV
jgi:hypothetical protein